MTSDLALTIYGGLFTAVLLPLLGFLGKALWDFIKERDRDGRIRDAIETGVRFAEQVASSKEGQEKLRIATEQASALLWEHGIEMPPEVLRARIEACVNALFGEWHDGLTATVAGTD